MIKSISPPMLSTATPLWSATVTVIESGADNGDPLVRAVRVVKA
ncbi:hypothetical protein BCGT_3549 [Mycobacterium tuberculosis variant bovis BCG str. ATCC 35743]|nr:hypothetical protein BCGT_3549 [Mycobacterium tuberculosis variant bovis BCG str. ATCC 35743]ALA80351.1 Uncharacterized protein BCGR_4036 [Mycobacterium tuberculosis variant bovis BCG]